MKKAVRKKTINKGLICKILQWNQLLGAAGVEWPTPPGTCMLTWETNNVRLIIDRGI